MKKISLLSLLSLLMLIVFLSSCKKDEEITEAHTHMHDEAEEYDYRIDIISSSADDKNMGDTIPLHVVFESGLGETVHHVNLRLYNQADSTVVYSEPNVAHVHEGSGKYTLQDELILSEENGMSPHSNWVLEAKVWGHGADSEKVTKQMNFHVHPQ